MVLSVYGLSPIALIIYVNVVCHKKLTVVSAKIFLVAVISAAKVIDSGAPAVMASLCAVLILASVAPDTAFAAAAAASAASLILCK